ncbi:MAG: fluoride efflux transporter CrcB [Micropepsaceae bacterium]
MILIFIIGAGGAIGAVCRYLLASQIAQVAGTQFPWGILIVNVLGGFAMGVIAELGALSLGMSQETKSFLTTGVLGGFTTFSAFSLDTALLIERGDIMNAAAYVLSSVIGSVAALFVGLYLIRMVIP